MKQKKKKGGFLPMLSGVLATIILGNALTSRWVISAGEGTIKAGEKVLMPPHPLTNFEIRNYEKEPKFNSVYLRNNCLK